MYSLYKNDVVRALVIGAAVAVFVLVASAAILLAMPQNAHAQEWDLDFGAAEWGDGGDCCSGGGDVDWGGDCCTDWSGNDCCYDDSGWGDCCYDGGYDDGCYDWCGGDYDGCYDYCGGDYDGCYDYCGDDYDGCYDYCGDYDDDYCDYECYDDYDDYCDYECDEFYEVEESEHYQTGSGGAKYSSSGSPKFSMPSFSGGFSGGSAPMKFSNMPSYTPSYPSYPVQNHPAPISNNTTITTTNIDNSIRDSFNDNSVNVIGSFNTENSNNTAVAIGGSTWGTVTPIASVTPGRTIAAVIPSYTSTYSPAPVYRAPIFPADRQYVALSQIPYTGFDLGPVGNALYWMSLMGVAVAGAYLVLYYQGGALAFVGGFMKKNRSTKREEVSTPVLPTVATEKKEASFSTKDTMRFTEKGIVIDRSF